MSEFMKLVIVFISMLVLFYFLWVNGYMILNAKRALLFVVSLRGKNNKHQFDLVQRDHYQAACADAGRQAYHGIRLEMRSLSTCSRSCGLSPSACA